MTPPPLERHGRFLLLRALAEGGMGLVSIAYDPKRARVVALKRLGRRVSDELRARFIDESRVTRRLVHPHLVEFVDAGEIDDELYLALGFVPGHDLHALCVRLWEQGQRFPVERALELARQLADGLAYAHARGDGSYVHRDVTPMNVLVGFDGSVRLADHGLALTRSKGFRTVPGVATGTVGFVSPEQLAARPVDRRSDVYGVGAVLWFMLTGRPPCDPLDPTKSLVVERRLSHFAPSLPEEVQAVVYRALATLPAERYESAQALRRALDAVGASPSTSPSVAPTLVTLMDACFPGEARALEEELARFAAQAAVSAPRLSSARTLALGLGAAGLALLALALVVSRTSRPAGFAPVATARARIAPIAAPTPAVLERSGTAPVPGLPARSGGPGGTIAQHGPAGVSGSGRPGGATAPGERSSATALAGRHVEARALARRGMFARALILYDELERDGASRPQVLTGRAEVALLRGEHEEAIRLASQAIALGGGQAPLLVRARALRSGGRSAESEADYRAVLTADPRNGDARRALDEAP